jgi:hypothetical protein
MSVGVTKSGELPYRWAQRMLGGSDNKRFLHTTLSVQGSDALYLHVLCGVLNDKNFDGLTGDR